MVFLRRCDAFVSLLQKSLQEDTNAYKSRGGSSVSKLSVIHDMHIYITWNDAIMHLSHECIVSVMQVHLAFLVSQLCSCCTHIIPTLCKYMYCSMCTEFGTTLPYVPEPLGYACLPLLAQQSRVSKNHSATFGKSVCPPLSPPTGSSGPQS